MKEAPPGTNTTGQQNPWQPGLWKAAPWFGLFALLGGMIFTAATAVVLKLSDGKETASWPTETTPVSPAVMLAVLTAAANAMLVIAFRDGCRVAWWLKMLKGGRINDCHGYWAYSSSLLQGARSGNFLNKVALACFATSFLIIDGPVLQRTSTVVARSTNSPTSFSVFMSPDPFPVDFSGYYQTHSAGINMLTDNFGKVAKEFTSHNVLSLNYSRCAGTCTGVLIAPGFDVNCTSTNRPYNLSGSAGDTFVVGSTNISWSGMVRSGNIIVETVYKPNPGVVGSLVSRHCSLQIGTIEYPLQVSNGTVVLTPRASTDNDTIELQYPPNEAFGRGIWPSRLGGIAYVASYLYTSNISLYYELDQYAVFSTGPMASLYLNSSAESYGTPNMTWADPIPDILSGIRELTFRAAISKSNGSYSQQVNGAEVGVRAYYVSHYLPLAVALAFMGFSGLTIAFLFIGWWHLGRVVSLSPVEIAKAFGAPMFVEDDSNAGADKLLRTFGLASVQYGAVEKNSGEVSGGPPRLMGKGLSNIGTAAGTRSTRSRLEIAETKYVSPPLKGVAY